MLLKSIARIVPLAIALGLAMPAIAQDLPPVPAAIKKQGVLKAGIKCDYPPDGYLDAQGKNKGVEVDLARQIAAYAFGSPEKIELTCVTAANRIPSLQGGKIDLIIATLGVSAERAQVIDFSDNYAWGASDVLIAKDSPIKSLKELAGKTVIVMKGAWQIGWFEKNVPTANLLKLDGVSDGLTALLQKRADAFAHDFAVLQPIASKNAQIKLLAEPYQLGFRAVGIRKGETEWVKYINAAIAKAKKDGVIVKSIKAHVEPDQQQSVLDNWDISKSPKATN